MKKILKIIISVALIGGAIFFYKEPLERLYAQVVHYYFPCQSPITYSIGTFDTKFGISQADFLQAVVQAETIWEKPISKELFTYDPKGHLKINLIYDERQEATVKLQNLGFTVNNDKATYDTLKAKYDALEIDYKQKKAQFDTLVSQFESEKAKYESEVSAANRKGRVSEDTYNRLNAEKDRLNAEVTQIQNLQNSLNAEVDEINALATTLNRLAGALNLEVKQFNTIGSDLGGEFDEGVYQSGPNGEQINIYQFENKSKLVRVLAHELGHALGLDHVDDPKAIMYRLNNGINEKPTATDITQLKQLCRIK